MLKFNLNKIDNAETKKMFKTILQSFYNDDYRASIVSLYTLVIFDVVQKMTENINYTNNSEIISIKKELDEKAGQSDVKYSEIEKHVVNELYNKRKIGKVFFSKIDSLRKERNNCAHFGLYSEKLYFPSEEITADYISFFYINLFSKTPDMLSNVKDLVLEAIQKYYNLAIFLLDEEGKSLITKDFQVIIENSVQDKTIKDLHDSLFDLLLLKNDEDCQKYRAYTLIAFKVLMDYMKEYGLINNFDFSRYRRLKFEHLEAERFDGFAENPIYELIQNGYINKEVLQEQNNEFLLCVIYEIKKNIALLYKYWNIVFESELELNVYLRSCNYNIATLSYFGDEILEQETIYSGCINELKSVPHYRGYSSAINALSTFRTMLDKLAEGQIKECLSIINGNDQFYSGYVTPTDLELIGRFLEEKTSISKYDYPNLYKTDNNIELDN